MKPWIGFALCGSFCTFGKAIGALELLTQEANVLPIFSETAYGTDTRFGKAREFIEQVEALCGRSVLHSIPQVEPLGPGKLLQALVVAPCTGNTLAKLAGGIADSAVSFACKAHLRNNRPVVLGISTNDGLSGAAANLGLLLNRRNYYFVPFGQDSPQGKPCSLVAHMELLPDTLREALAGRQIQPLLV